MGRELHTRSAVKRCENKCPVALYTLNDQRPLLRMTLEDQVVVAARWKTRMTHIRVFLSITFRKGLLMLDR